MTIETGENQEYIQTIRGCIPFFKEKDIEEIIYCSLSEMSSFCDTRCEMKKTPLWKEVPIDNPLTQQTLLTRIRHNSPDWENKHDEEIITQSFKDWCERIHFWRTQAEFG